MGGRLSDGEASELLTREPLVELGAGAPTPAAAGTAPASAPDRSVLRAQSSGREVQHVGERSPALFVTLSFAGPRGPKEVKLEWSEGMKLRHYLDRARMLGVRLRCRLINSQKQKVRMSYVPGPGEEIRLIAPNAPIR